MDKAYDGAICHLNKIALLSESEQDYFRKVFSCRRLRKNEAFLSAGSPLTHIGFNLNSVFRYFYIDYDGNDTTKYFVFENSFILSLSAFIENSVSRFSIEALEDCELLVAPAENIRAHITQSAVWSKIYLDIVQKTYIEKEKREAELLLYNATDRYIHFLSEHPNAHTKIKQHHIASYLGIAPESLSRIRSQIEKA